MGSEAYGGWEKSPRSHPAIGWSGFEQILRVAAFVMVAAISLSPAVAQETPIGIAPLRADPDPNGVNLFTGKITTEVPTLSVPAAPRLKFSRVQDVALLEQGSQVSELGEMFPSTYTVDTIGGVSETFQCQDRTKRCENSKGTGSVISSNGYDYLQAGTGIAYHYTLWSSVTQQNGETKKVWHIETITYPDGEILTFTWETQRPIRVSSNLGYYLNISYAGSVFGTDDWNTVSRAAIFKSSDPTTPLRSFDYSLNGAITTVTETAGSTTRQYFLTGISGLGATKLEAASGSVQRPTEASNSITYNKHPTLNLISSVVRDGVTWTYTYTNPVFYAGYAEYRYDRIVAAGPNSYNITYDLGSENEVETRTDELNRATNYEYDVFKRLTKITYPEGNSVSIAYDDVGNIVTKTSTPKPGTTGSIVEQAFVDIDPYRDQFGEPRLCSVLCWRPAWTRDGLNRQTDYVYNALGQLTEQTEPADAAGVRRKTYIEYENDNTGAGTISRKKAVRICGWHPTNPALTTCGTNAEFRTEYDYFEHTFLPAAERQVDLATGQIRQTSYTYDPAGRVLSVDGPLPGANDTQYFRYDSYGRKTREIGALAPSGLRIAKRTTYRDSDDKPIKVETGTIPDQASNMLTVLEQTDLTYDSRRNPIREATSSASTTYKVTDRSFLDRGMADCQAVRMNMAALPAASATAACALGTPGADGQDRIAKNTYDAAGQLTKVQQGYGTTSVRDQVTYTYTPNGKRQFITDANGNKAQFKYDGYDRQSHWYFPSKTTAGTVSTTDFEQYGYDGAGNRTSLRKRDGRTLTFGYDGRNQMVSKLVPDGCAPIQVGGCPAATATRDVFYAYDMMGRQLTAKFDSVAGADGLSSAYDPFGNLASSTIAMGGLSKTLTSLYDEAGNRTRLTHPDGVYFTMGYDAPGRMANASWTVSGVTTPFMAINYEPSGRRSNINRASSWTAYGYDAVGRLAWMPQLFAGDVGNVTETFGYNPASQITGEARDNDEYAWNGAVAVNRAYAVNGLNQYTTAGSAAFTYDANGNLITDGTNSYVYDAENRLVSATAGGTTASLTYDPMGRLWQVVKGAADTRFLYDGDELTAEYDGAGSMTRRFFFGPNTDEPILEDPGGSLACTNGTRFLHTNHQGSIVALADCWGARTNIDSYDEYGIPGSGNTGRFQYTGQAWLPELGMYYYKARIYSPTLGRFLQTDPIGYDDQFNLYAYVGNDPANKTDPSGTETSFEVGLDHLNRQLASGQINPERYQELVRAQSNGGEIGSMALPIEGLALKGIAWLGRAFEFGSVGRPVAVLGHYPGYVALADRLGARVFSVPTKIWDKMRPAEQWAANQKFLDRQILDGATFRLSTPANKARVGSSFEREVNYLKSKGYQVSKDGMSMNPVKAICTGSRIPGAGC